MTQPLQMEIVPPQEDELLVVVGPTASGKTELAILLAEMFNGEVVGADSVQIYQRFDIGSGKPNAQERARVPHHLVDIVDARSPIDAQQYADMSDRVLEDIRKRGRIPIVCGGSFLWVKALVWGFARTPPGDTEVRARHRVIAETQGRAALHARLAEVDPESASRLAPNDYVRVSRALEIYELTGKPQSQWHIEHGFRSQRCNVRWVGVHRERDELDQRIVQRTALWLEQGWIEEVESLMTEGYGQTRPMSCVGYKQVGDHLRGQLSRAELCDAVVRATRVFVRRQRTWLRDIPVQWVSMG